MNTAHTCILLASMLPVWLLVSASGTTFDMENQSPKITNFTGISIPAGTTQVRFQKNAISHIYAGYFRNLRDLVTIYLYDNQILDMEDYSFIGVPSIKTLHIKNNKLSIILTHQFSGLINLEILYLYSNRISIIQDESFKDLISLNKFDLRWNLVQTLSQYIFDMENHPVALDLNLKFLPLKCNSSLCWVRESVLYLKVWHGT